MNESVEVSAAAIATKPVSVRVIRWASLIQIAFVVLFIVMAIIAALPDLSNPVLTGIQKGFFGRLGIAGPDQYGPGVMGEVIGRSLAASFLPIGILYALRAHSLKALRILAVIAVLGAIGLKRLPFLETIVLIAALRSSVASYFSLKKSGVKGS
jgi:hypothetical protein